MWYFHDEETGMEYWHGGPDTWERDQCHDGVGLVTRHPQSFDDFLAMFPYAELVDDE